MSEKEKQARQSGEQSLVQELTPKEGRRDITEKAKGEEGVTKTGKSPRRKKKHPPGVAM